MRSPIYWHRGIYRYLASRYHPDWDGRYSIVGGLIAPGTSVLDLCCGDARLFTHCLKNRDCNYIGLDLSLAMAPHTVRHRLVRANVRTVDFPVSDYVVMMGSLYHFYPETEELLSKMRNSARRTVIIVEQIQSAITSLPHWLSRFLSDPGNGSGDFRFKRSDLERLVRIFDPEARISPIVKGHDLLIEISGRASEKKSDEPERN